MLNKIQILKTFTGCILLILLSGFFISANADSFCNATGNIVQELAPIPIKSNDVTILMSDRAKFNGAMKVFNIGRYNLKRFWVENWTNPEESFEWTVEAPQDGLYKAEILIAGAIGVKVEIAGPVNKLVCALQESGWDKVEVPGELKLRQGTNTITMKALDAANLKLKSLELINLGDKTDIEQRIKEFRSDTKWLADVGYGLMVQWGGWGYPKHGPKKDWPKMIDDFDVVSFAEMVQEMGLPMWFGLLRGSHTIFQPL